MKNSRHKIILELIESEAVTTQSRLMELLAERGIVTTQATLSRDIQQLSLIKQRDSSGVSRYALPAATITEKNIIDESVLSVDYAMNMIVIKCRAGMAQGTCAAIDSTHHDEIVGTIAGDDTIFILVRTESDARKLAKKFQQKIFPGGKL